MKTKKKRENSGKAFSGVRAPTFRTSFDRSAHDAALPTVHIFKTTREDESPPCAAPKENASRP